MGMHGHAWAGTYARSPTASVGLLQVCSRQRARMHRSDSAGVHAWERFNERWSLS